MNEYNAKVQAAEANKAVWDGVMSEIQKRDYARMQQEEAEAKAREKAAEPSGRGEASEQTENAAGSSEESENRKRTGRVQEFDERQSDLQPEEVTAKLSSDKTDEFGKPLVLAKDGSTTFGIIDKESGLKEAPIQLSLGENYVGEDGKNHGYGLITYRGWPW